MTIGWHLWNATQAAGTQAAQDAAFDAWEKFMELNPAEAGEITRRVEAQDDAARAEGGAQ